MGDLLRLRACLAATNHYPIPCTWIVAFPGPPSRPIPDAPLSLAGRSGSRALHGRIPNELRKSARMLFSLFRPVARSLAVTFAVVHSLLDTPCRNYPMETRTSLTGNPTAVT
jgi:hypothetical protein